MEEKEEGSREGIRTLIQEDYDKIDSIYTRIINANDDLESLLKVLSRERGSVAARYILSNAKEVIDLGIKGIEKILYGEVK